MTCVCLFQLRYTDILFTEQEVCASFINGFVYNVLKGNIVNDNMSELSKLEIVELTLLQG